MPLSGEVKPTDAQASYKNGVLRIELPKPSSQRRRAIKVDVR
ncbi:Hsp20 family protein [Nitrosomonas sp. Nm51]|nr:Hsp20 family protein [Nitrosomonas sp. Nm51]